MIDIREEYVQYAVNLLAEDARYHSYDWEECLRTKHADFYKFYIKAIFGAAKPEEDNLPRHQETVVMMRSLCGLVYAPIHQAMGNAFPPLSEAKARDFWNRYRTAGSELRQSVKACLRAGSLDWSHVVMPAVESITVPANSRYIFYMLAGYLMSAIEEWQNGDIEIVFPDASGNFPQSDTLAKQAVSTEGDVITVVAKPDVTWDDVGGQAKAKRELKKLASALKDPARYKRWGSKPVRGVCLHGPSGNGKTLLAKALANATDVPFYSLKLSDVFTKWYGESQKMIGKVFAQVRATGGILFIDEADGIIPSRSSGIHEESQRVVDVLLQNMDGFDKNDRVVVLFATNFIEQLDEAATRPGRVDLLIEVPLPDEVGRREILEINMKRAIAISERELFNNVDLGSLVEKMEGRSGADIAEVMRRTLEEKVIAEEAAPAGTEIPLVVTSDILAELTAYERSPKKAKKSIGFDARKASAA